MKANGKNIVLESPKILADFLKENNYDTRKIVIELNEKIIPKDKYGITELKDTDVLEVLTFVGGG